MAERGASNDPIGLPLCKLKERDIISFELWINSYDCEWDFDICSVCLGYFSLRLSDIVCKSMGRSRNVNDWVERSIPRTKQNDQLQTLLLFLPHCINALHTHSCIQCMYYAYMYNITLKSILSGIAPEDIEHFLV